MTKKMRSLLILIDGLGDDPNNKIGGLTPLAFAATPYLDKLAASGAVGHASICEQDLVPESCSCILRLLGMPNKDIPKNRAYLELLAHNRDVTDEEMVKEIDYGKEENPYR